MPRAGIALIATENTHESVGYGQTRYYFTREPKKFTVACNVQLSPCFCLCSFFSLPTGLVPVYSFSSSCGFVLATIFCSSSARMPFFLHHFQSSCLIFPFRNLVDFFFVILLVFHFVLVMVLLCFVVFLNPASQHDACFLHLDYLTLVLVFSIKQSVTEENGKYLRTPVVPR